jgi:drug/metabolite transporter (DMT)-like permease
MAEAPRPRTSPIIFVAMGLMVFAVAAPFIGSFIQDMSPDGQNVMLGAFFGWSLAGLAAGGLGVICTIVGARRAPRSRSAILAIVMAVLLVVAVISLMALLLL